uniref:Uncharacterized protein n=1 Tax=Emiliania huxleyi TaxID=2903 RepID=A0A7S3RN84_EMIHU
MHRSRRAMCRLRWLLSLAPHPSKIEKAPVCATQVVSIYGSRTSSIPLGLRDRRNPPDYKYLEYDVYGWFRYDGDADGVKGLDRKWVDVDSLKRITNWTAVQGKVEEYEKGLTALREENVGVAQKLKREAETDGGGGFGLGR